MAKVKRQTLKYQQQQIINAEHDYDVLHPETEASIVELSSEKVKSTNVEAAIDELYDKIESQINGVRDVQVEGVSVTDEDGVANIIPGEIEIIPDPEDPESTPPSFNIKTDGLGKLSDVQTMIGLTAAAISKSFGEAIGGLAGTPVSSTDGSGSVTVTLGGVVSSPTISIDAGEDSEGNKYHIVNNAELEQKTQAAVAEAAGNTSAAINKLVGELEDGTQTVRALRKYDDARVSEGTLPNILDYVDAKSAGKVGYWGTADTLTEVFVKMANAEEGDLLRVTTQFAVGDDIAHVGDMIVAKVDKPTTVTDIKVAHTEIDTNTWTANSKTANGFVAKGEGNPGKFWGTDSEGNPGWMYLKPDINNACKTQIRQDEDDYYMAYESGIGNPYLYIQDFDDPNRYHYSGLLVSHYTYKNEECYLYIGNDRVMTDRTDVVGWYDTAPNDMKYYLFKYNDFRKQWEVSRNSSPETVARKVANEITQAKLDDFKGTPAEGTYSVVRTNANGVVQAGGSLIEVGADTTSEPSANLVVGGIFFKPIEVSE